MASKGKPQSRAKDLERDVNRLSGINGMLTERNEALRSENLQLREALTNAGLFKKASEIQTRDVRITADKFGQLFVVLRNNMTNGTSEIMLQLNDEGTSVTSITPKVKEVVQV